MSSVEKIGIAGFRSYHPQNMQFVDFFRPLTLICGENGSGKTTIIECLRLITTGKTPPNTNSGKTFVMDPILVEKNEVVGTIKLQFIGAGQRRFVASKLVQLAKIRKKDATKIEYKSIQQHIKTRDPNTNELISISHHCGQIEKQVPNLFGVTPSIMENVIFCHQEQSLWPFSDNNTLKNIFDQLFETKTLTKTYDAMKQQVKKLTKQHRELGIKYEGIRQMQLKLLRERKINLDQMADFKIMVTKLLPLKKKMNELNKDDVNWEKSHQTYKNMSRQHGALIAQRDSILRILGADTNYCDKDLVNNSTVLLKTKKYIEQQLVKTETKCKQSRSKITQQQVQYMKLRSTQSKKQIISLFGLQLRRIKQSLPSINIEDSDNTCSKTLKKLQDQGRRLYKQEQFLEKLKNQYRSIEVTEMISQDSQFYKDIRDQVSEIQRQQKARQNNLKTLFKKLYKPIQASNRKTSVENPRFRLNDIECLIRDRQATLAKYANLLTPSKQKPRQQAKRTKSQLKNQIQKMKYVGIDLQKQLFEYCKLKKKCYFCSKPQTEQELKLLETKCEKMKSNTESKVEKLTQELSEAPDDRHIQNARTSLEHIKREVQELKKQRQKLLEQQKTYAVYSENMKRVEISAKLQQTARGVSIQFDKSGTGYDQNINIIVQNEQLTLFNRFAQEYAVHCNQMKRMERQLRRGQSIKQENRRRQQKRLDDIQRKSGIQAHIYKLEQSLKIRPLVEASIKRLQQISANGESSSIELTQAQSIPPPSIHSSTKTRELYALLLSNRTQYNRLSQQLVNQRESLSQINSKLALSEILTKIKNIQKQIKDWETEKNQRIANHKQYTEVKEQYSRIEAAVKSFRKSFQMRRIDFNQEECWNILMEMGVVEGVIEQYSRAMKSLDKALLDFHRQKMQIINNTLKETWQDIYHGSDIKYIQIKATAEETSKRKTYGYAVTMILPDDTQIEMKGRCSMGQKVLASIVVRLALAQSFEGRCSMLALDEPTTNLDHQHIHKLGVELSKLLASRRDNKSFQLIIISHDVDFMRVLKDYATQYYLVRKDPKHNKFSQVQVKSIQQLK